ncbi:MAG: glycosyltransferase [Actinomycetes bacterium]
MRTLLVTTGSRGDVQPFLALARGLTDAGHGALVAAPRRFAGLAAAIGVDFVGLDDSLFQLQDDLVGAGGWAAVTAVRRVKPFLRAWLEDLSQLADAAADAVVFTQKSLGGRSIAEKLKVPALPAQLVPLTPPTAAFVNPVAPALTPALLARASWSLTDAVELPWRGMVAQWRSERLGLPARVTPLSDVIAANGILSAWSAHLLPAPPDWPKSARPLGFWTPPASDWQPPDALQAFLDAGPAPVLVGFGSMTTRDPAALTAEVGAGLRRAGRRGIIVAGWAGLGVGGAGDDVMVLDEAPYESLLPLVAAVVHHGGIGTVGAALRAGVPQVIHPFFGDQPFWARQLQRLGVAPPPLRRLRAADLAVALRATEGMAARAQQLGAVVRDEDGITAARLRIEDLVRRPPAG